MRNTLLSLTLLTSTAIAVPAHADVGLGGGFSVSGNAAITTDYRFRGVSFSDEDFAVQGGIDLAHDSGFYVGAWGSSIEDSPVFGDTEIDIYAGWSGEIASGTTIDIGVLAYFYPDGDVGDADYIEPYVSLSHSLGPAQVTVGAAYAPSQNSIGNADNIYVYTNLGVGIPGSPVTLNAHLGYNDGSLSVGPDGDYTDWSVGADAVFGIVTLGIAYVDTNVGGAGTDGTVVGTVSVSF